MSFQTTLSSVLLTLMYIAPSYLLCKCKKATAEHLPTLSALLVYVCAPCLAVSSLLNLDYSPGALKEMGLFFLITLFLQAAFMAILYVLFHRKYDDARYRILNIASVLGNVGFFGLPVVAALMPDHPEVSGYVIMYIFSMNMLVYTMGVFCLTRDKRYMSLKAALLNPTTLGFAVALPLYLTGSKVFLPPLLLDSVQLVGRMCTPLCMFILRIRLSAVPLKRLLGQPFLYGIAFCKLLVFPLFAFGCVYFLPLPAAFKASILVLSAAPSGAIIQSLAELHNSETELSAHCVLLSTLMCFLTIPVMTLLA